MTQPPSPSAAALALADQLRDMLNFTWSVAGNVLTFDSTRAALAIDAFAAQAVAPLQAEIDSLTSTQVQAIYDRDIAWRRIAELEAERAKPAASDHEAVVAIIDEFLEWARQAADTFAAGARTANLEDRARGALDLALALRSNKKAGLHPSWLENNLAAALAERGRVERERCAQVAETQKCPSLHGGPETFEGWRWARDVIAAAIRNQTLTGSDDKR